MSKTRKRLYQVVHWQRQVKVFIITGIGHDHQHNLIITYYNIIGKITPPNRPFSNNFVLAVVN